MRRLLGYGLLGLLAYAVFMLVLCPADIMMERVAQRLPGFSVQNAQGSAVQGTARGMRLHTLQLESISWRLHFPALLTGHIEYHVTLVEPDLQLSGSIGMGLDRQWRIAALNGSLPLSKAIALAGYSTPLLSGTLKLAPLELRLDPAGHLQQAQGLLRLRNVQTRLGKPVPLGDFNIELQTRNTRMVAAIQDQGGPLQFTGALTLDPDGRYFFTGQAAIRDGKNWELYQVLGSLGQPGGEGKWTFNFAGNWQV
jgi:hypothetical protein